MASIDPDRGYNLNDIQDCLDALNSLPDRQKRNLLQRIKVRIYEFYAKRRAVEGFKRIT